MKNNEIALLPGVCYHIFNHANGFENLFLSEGNYLYFLRTYAEHPAEWPHSSFMSLLSDKPSRLSRDEVLAFFGGRDAFLAAHDLKPDDRFLKMVSEWY